MKKIIEEKIRVPSTKDETRFITAPEGLISQGHIGNYAAKIQFFLLRCLFLKKNYFPESII